MSSNVALHALLQMLACVTVPSGSFNDAGIIPRKRLAAPVRNACPCRWKSAGDGAGGLDIPTPGYPGP